MPPRPICPPVNVNPCPERVREVICESTIATPVVYHAVQAELAQEARNLAEAHRIHDRILKTPLEKPTTTKIIAQGLSAGVDEHGNKVFVVDSSMASVNVHWNRCLNVEQRDFDGVKAVDGTYRVSRLASGELLISPINGKDIEISVGGRRYSSRDIVEAKKAPVVATPAAETVAEATSASSSAASQSAAGTSTSQPAEIAFAPAPTNHSPTPPLTPEKERTHNEARAAFDRIEDQLNAGTEASIQKATTEVKLLPKGTRLEIVRDYAGKLDELMGRLEGYLWSPQLVKFADALAFGFDNDLRNAVGLVDAHSRQWTTTDRAGVAEASKVIAGSLDNRDLVSWWDKVARTRTFSDAFRGRNLMDTVTSATQAAESTAPATSTAAVTVAPAVVAQINEGLRRDYTPLGGAGSTSDKRGKSHLASKDAVIAAIGQLDPSSAERAAVADQLGNLKEAIRAAQYSLNLKSEVGQVVDALIGNPATIAGLERLRHVAGYGPERRTWAERWGTIDPKDQEALTALATALKDPNAAKLADIWVKLHTDGGYEDSRAMLDKFTR